MSREQPDPLEAFQMLKQAFEGDGNESARVKALIGAQVASSLLLAEKVADLDQMLGLLVQELRLQRVARSGSNGSRVASSPSRSTPTSDTSGTSGGTDEP